MGLFLNLMSEKQLRKKEKKMRNKLDKMDWNSKRHTRKDKKRIDVVNAISSKYKW